MQKPPRQTLQRRQPRNIKLFRPSAFPLLSFMQLVLEFTFCTEQLCTVCPSAWKQQETEKNGGSTLLSSVNKEKTFSLMNCCVATRTERMLESRKKKLARGNNKKLEVLP